MTHRGIFLTHADVVIDPDVPVPDWGLNEAGRQRHAQFANHEILENVRAIFCSAERKAMDAAEITGEHLGLEPHIRPSLSENDRSATGFLPADAFWPVVEAFFANPETSIKGWERACDAQSRITAATHAVLDEVADGDALVISHGGVATLLRCHLLNRAISKSEGQPHPNGGCWFAFDRDMTTAPTAWNAI